MSNDLPKQRNTEQNNQNFLKQYDVKIFHFTKKFKTLQKQLIPVPKSRKQSPIFYMDVQRQLYIITFQPKNINKHLNMKRT